MIFKKTFFYQVLPVVIAGLSIAAFVFAWTEPTTAPPSGNVAAPLNVSNVGQSKEGGLILNTGGATNGLIVANGNVGIGLTNPGAKLHIANTTDAEIRMTAASSWPLILKQDVGSNFSINNDNAVRFYIKAGGNVGIGTADPSYKLDVRGNAVSDTDVISVRSLSTGQYANIGFRRASDGAGWEVGYEQVLNGFLVRQTNTGNRFFIDSAGNVGIGLTNPGAKLDVNGQIKITGGSPGAGKVLTSDASGLASWQTSAGGGLPSGSAGQTLRHDGTNWVANSVLYNNGTNVGIGTTGPRGKLEVAGTYQILTVSSENASIATGNYIRGQNDHLVINAGGTSGTGTLYLNFTGDGGTKITRINEQLYVDGTGLNIGSMAAPSNKLTVTGNANITGNVGIGTTGPTIKLAIGDTDTGLQWVSDGNLAVYTNNAERVRINSSGNVGIGTASPSRPLDVNGTVRTTNYFEVSNSLSPMGNTYGLNGISTNYNGGDFQIGGGGGAVNDIILAPPGMWGVGNVGIGTTNPVDRLDVAGTARVDYLRIDPQDGGFEGGELQLIGAGSYGTFQIDNYQGNARIYTLAPGKQFQVLGGGINAQNYNICYRIECAGGLEGGFTHGDEGRLNADPATPDGWAWCEPTGDMTRVRFRLYTCD